MAEALEEVWEVVAGPRSPLAEELVRPDWVPEHARRVVTVNTYERSAAARPMYNWPKILNQLAIRFEQRLQL